MLLTDWLDKYNLPTQARRELIDILDHPQLTAQSQPGTKEASTAKAIRAAAAARGIKLFRNNVGVAVDNRGIPIRYGLANESKQMQEILKSSDFIGVVPIKITAGHLGKTIGQFVAIETKRGGWKFTGTPRERAQKRFLDLICAAGGAGIFASSIDDLEHI
jgi:hypothetical protein